ncbi:Polyol/monosaccharide transporter 5 isoform 3 [Hibiscus syriacus]|uniref:Polyol/monosaccharide transporter 5 isoform 3 n=1 Tax=Hibiscus syriacus TaxID=106335 RepID=A0A6A2WXY9_HIBSY|nr:Polyol/monosaccharide transporter 5 isoform 3 [Hibiscus syriacus]
MASEVSQMAANDMESGKAAGLNKYTLFCALLASTNSILLGYGSLASGKTSVYIGRLYTIVLAAATFLVGAILMGFALSFPWLLAGRVVAGIGVGYSLMISPLYTAEISPAMKRGFLTCLPEVFIVTGILIGYIVNYSLSGLPQNINWRLMLGLAAVPAIAIGIGVTEIPESPRWLVMKGRTDEASRVLIKVSDSVQEAEFRLSEITKAAASMDSINGDWHGQGVWKELMLNPSRPVRQNLIAAIGINFFMQASGNDAIRKMAIVVARHRRNGRILGRAGCFILLDRAWPDHMDLFVGDISIEASGTGNGAGYIGEQVGERGDVHDVSYHIQQDNIRGHVFCAVWGLW